MPHRFDEVGCRAETMAPLEVCKPGSMEHIDQGEQQFGPDGFATEPARPPSAPALRGCTSSWSSMLRKKFGRAGVDDEISGVIRWLDGLEGIDNPGTAAPSASSGPRRLPSGRARFCGSPSAAACAGTSMLLWPQKEDPDVSRSAITGKVGRAVSYCDGESPTLDILGLRGGLGQAVIVTQLRRHGAAERAGVRCGYELVSVDGHKDLLKLAASEILKRLIAPVTLVFLGFLGKFPAEVRLLREEDHLGLRPKEAICSPTDPITVQDEVVFNPGKAPLWLCSSHDNSEDTLPFTAPPLLYELHLHEARRLVHGAVEGVPEEKSQAMSGNLMGIKEEEDDALPISEDPMIRAPQVWHSTASSHATASEGMMQQVTNAGHQENKGHSSSV